MVFAPASINFWSFQGQKDPVPTWVLVDDIESRVVVVPRCFDIRGFNENQLLGMTTMHQNFGFQPTWTSQNGLIVSGLVGTSEPKNTWYFYMFLHH